MDMRFGTWNVRSMYKMDLREIGWDGVDWIYLAQNRVLVNTVMNLWVP
jgi:hypothetical protein